MQFLFSRALARAHLAACDLDAAELDYREALKWGGGRAEYESMVRSRLGDPEHCLALLEEFRQWIPAPRIQAYQILAQGHPQRPTKQVDETLAESRRGQRRTFLFEVSQMRRTT